MHPGHAVLLGELKGLARPETADHDHNAYLGSARPMLRVTVPERRTIAKAWLASRKAIGVDDIMAVVESLFEGETHEEKTLACLILAGRTDLRRAVRPDDVDRWLGLLDGWAEVDSLCQHLFKAEDLLADWPAWRGLIERLSRDADLDKRRASLVLLTGPVRYSANPRFPALAFAMVERAIGEKDILVTKAVSWLLRAMSDRHPEAVAAYVEANAPRLPAIAVRETRTKLRTGKKNA